MTSGTAKKNNNLIAVFTFRISRKSVRTHTRATVARHHLLDILCKFIVIVVIVVLLMVVAAATAIATADARCVFSKLRIPFIQ